MSSVASTQALVREELLDLAERLAHAPTADETTLRQVTRMVAALDGLLREHALDRRGQCAKCGRRRRCPVMDVLTLYAAGWMASAPEATPAARHAAPARPGRWLTKPDTDNYPGILKGCEGCG